MHLLEVRPPVPGLALDGDLEAGRHPLHLQPPQLVVRGARQDLLGPEPLALPAPATLSLLDIRLKSSSSDIDSFGKLNGDGESTLF